MQKPQAQAAAAAVGAATETASVSVARLRPRHLRTTGVRGTMRMIVKGTKVSRSFTVRRSACTSRGFRVPPAGWEAQWSKARGSRAKGRG